jgi:hypothetical protein
MIMLDDAVRANGREDDVRVLDIAQLVEESMRVPEPAGLPGPGSRTDQGNAPQLGG